MFSIPVERIQFSDIEGFCSTTPRPHEGVLLDFKKVFPGRLDKAIAAFANTYGGHIFIGIDETPTGEPVLPI